MKIQVILRTRSTSLDYGWRCWPEYLDQKMKDTLSFVQEMLSRQAMTPYPFGESLHNYYYLSDENGCVLVHGVITDEVDNHGRHIFTLEGLACPIEKSGLFWYYLPALIDQLDRQPLFRKQYAHLIDQQMPAAEEIDTGADTDDNLFLDVDEKRSLWYTMRDHSDTMQRLWRDIHDSGEMFSFVYGTRPADFYPAIFSRIYSPLAAPADPVRPWAVSLSDVPVIPDEQNRFAVVIETEKAGRGGSYVASVCAYDAQANEIATTENGLRIGSNGIAISQLIDVRTAVRDCLKRYGYGRGGRS